MSPSLPPRPSLEWLRKAAKKRLIDLRRDRPGAQLADAQLALAREHGFPSWRALKSHIDQSASAAANARDGGGAMLLRAIAAGHFDDVRRMLDADPTLIEATGPHPFWGGRPQPLHVAIENDRRDIFDLLLERGADVDGKNAGYDHWSPLMLAIDRPDMRDELVRRGAAIGLAEALLLGDDARVEALLRESGLPETVPNAGSYLAFVRTTVAVDLLLAAGAQLEQKDRWGTRPVEAVARLGAKGVGLVEHMIERGAAVTPSDFARLGDMSYLVRLAGSDTPAATHDSVVMAAVDNRHFDLVAWLLDQGANPNARSDNLSQHTALHAAAWNGDLNMVKLLLGAGADPGLRDLQYDSTAEGWAATACEVRRDARCVEVAEYLSRIANEPPE